jgi:hypothetical protein
MYVLRTIRASWIYIIDQLAVSVICVWGYEDPDPMRDNFIIAEVTT